MPSKPISEDRREQIRRQEWEDREYVAQLRAEERAHELVLLDRKNAHAEKLATIKANATITVKVAETGNKLKLAQTDERLRRIAVHCITLLHMCGRQVPESLTSLLHK